jgi:hypothetical protein
MKKRIFSHYKGKPNKTVEINDSDCDNREK